METLLGIFNVIGGFLMIVGFIIGFFAACWLIAEILWNMFK